jgi:hypothetical protein
MKRFILILRRLIFSAAFLTTIFAAEVYAEKFRDFDGDGKTDFLVKRRNNQTAQLTWWILKSGGGYSSTQWGASPGNFTTYDVPINGDFDGDGKTDIAVFRAGFFNPPVPAYFYILRSSDNSVIAQQWGLSDDFPVVQDYDGDGKSDIAVARNEVGRTVWYMLQSRNGFQTTFLERCCSVLPGDYDGDGRGDFAVAYSEGNNGPYQYTIMMSRQKKKIFRTFGNASHQFVPADYDGDGKTDLGIRHAYNKGASGVWQWIKSSNGQIDGANLGVGFQHFDSPVQGDYDGDGKTDPAIYRPGDLAQGLPAYFIVKGSQRGFFTVQWGLDTDAP